VRTSVPQNYADKFSGNPEYTSGTLYRSADSKVSLWNQTSTSRKEGLGLQNKPGVVESEWSKRLHALEEQELAKEQLWINV